MRLNSEAAVVVAAACSVCCAPLVVAAARLTAQGIPADRLRAIEEEIASRIDAAVAAARASAEPEFASASAGVYASAGAAHA